MLGPLAARLWLLGPLQEGHLRLVGAVSQVRVESREVVPSGTHPPEPLAVPPDIAVEAVATGREQRREGECEELRIAG